jgi:ornithine carbamoyltransferase
MRHFLTLKDFSKTELLEMIALAQQIKQQIKERNFVPYLENQTLGMLFEKSSTRTRVSFETGIYQLGGIGLFLSSNDIQLGRGEPMKDTSRVISRMVDMVMIRTFEQSKIEEFAHYSKVPVINGLTDAYHPVQLMTDYLTMVEFGKDIAPVAAYIGDGNNMAHSWLMLASKLGFELRIATQRGMSVMPRSLQMQKHLPKRVVRNYASSMTLSKQSRDVMSSPQTPGSRWVKRRKKNNASKILQATWWMKHL